MSDILPLTLRAAYAEEADHAPEFNNVCAGPGCKRPPREVGKSLCSAHDKQAQRRGWDDLQPVGACVQATVPPCKRCRGKEFGIQTLRRRGSGEQYLSRYCVRCRARSTRAWAKLNPEAHRAAALKYKNANRDEINRKRRKRTSRSGAEEMPALGVA